jgi:hypothetical protein
LSIPDSIQNRETTYTIVACGSSAANWIPRGHCIGVNDAAKWGKPLDSLLCCNRPQQFNSERLQTIINTKVENFYSWKPVWSEHFPNWKKLRLLHWSGTLYDFSKDTDFPCYSSDSSPIIAITLAYHLGAKEIILWGVDMLNHHTFHPGNPYSKREMDVYLDVIGQMQNKGVKVYLGSEGSVFDNKINVYETTPVNS